MSRRVSWRRLVGEQLYAPVRSLPLPDPPATTAAALTRARNENATLLDELRGAARDRDRYLRERDAARVMLAAAARVCEAGCSHAALAADRLRQLEALQTLLDEVQERDLAAESPGFTPRHDTPPRRRRGPS